MLTLISIENNMSIAINEEKNAITIWVNFVKEMVVGQLDSIFMCIGSCKFV